MEIHLSRLRFEASYGARPDSLAHKLRPKYAQVNFTADRELGGGTIDSSFYGDVIAVLKNDAKRRSTWTIVDSLNAASHGLERVRRIQSTFYRLDFPTDVKNDDDYNEAQVFGEVTLDDVAYFIVLSKRKIDDLVATGIPVYRGFKVEKYGRTVIQRTKCLYVGSPKRSARPRLPLEPSGLKFNRARKAR
jgi:hypothetical protein